MDLPRIEAQSRKPFRSRARIRVTDHAARISGQAPSGGADVWLIRYDPQDLPVQGKGGDNRGKTVSQQNVVKMLVRLGQWRGGTRTYSLPDSPEPGLKTVLLLQRPRGGDIVSVGAGRP